MVVQDIKDFYGFRYNAEVARKYKVSKVAVGDWEKYGIPVKTQALIQVLSDNRLEADLSDYDEVETL